MWRLSGRMFLTPALAAAALLCPSSVLAYSQAQFDSVTSAEESEVYRVREQEIDQLKMVLGRRFAESRKPDLLLRLAELYIEKYRFYFFKENQIHQLQYKQGLKPKYVEHERSREQLKGATHACLAILQSRDAFTKLDEVYYFLGYNAEEMTHHKEATKYFEIVVSRFPNSNYAAEAYRNLGEDAFENSRYVKAVQYYEHAASYTKVPSYPRTLYKLAWAYFKTRRKADALAQMKRVVEISGGSEKFVGLREEALNDLVLFYSEAGKHKEAHDYFLQVPGGTEMYVKALSKLAGVYEHRGDYRLALNVNEGLASEYGEKRPDLIYDILGKNVELYHKLGDASGEESALNRLVQFFMQHSKEIGKNEDALATIARTKNYLRGRATETHKEAQKKKEKRLYSRAADLYALYLHAFLSRPVDAKEEKEASEIRVYRSDCLLAAGRESEGAIELERTLREQGDSKNRHEAGATLLNILIKRIDGTKGAAAKQAAEVQFLDISRVFEAAFPHDSLIPELRFKQARLVAAKSGPEGLSSDARGDLKQFIEKFPARPESAEAAHDLVADNLKRGENQKGSELAKIYLATPELMHADHKGELSKYLKSVLAHESFSEVAALEKDKNYAKAAQQYELLAEGSTADQEVAYKALNNAAVNYERAGQTDQTIRIYEKMISRFPKNQSPREDLKRLASQALWEARFSDAAKLYEKLALLKTFDSVSSRSFLRTAFWLYSGLGDLKQAYLLGTNTLHQYCTSSLDEQCHELELDVAHLLIDASRQEEALNHLKNYLKLHSPNLRKAEGNYLIAVLYQDLHEDRKALSYFEEAAGAVSRNGKRAHGGAVRERGFAARAAFLLVEPYFARFHNLKLELPEAHLKTVTKQKLSELESLVTRYQNVVAYGDGEWGIAALERLSDAFSNFAAELQAAPIPNSLTTPEQKLQYSRGLSQIAGPMAARALDYLRTGYRDGLRLEVTTPTFVALTQRLARRVPREFPPAHYALSESGTTTLRFVGQMPASMAEVTSKLKASPKLSEAWVEFGNLQAQSGRLKIARLLYEQAVSLDSRNAAALADLSITFLFENRMIEGVQGLAKAAELAEFNKEIQLNLAKVRLAFHHFGPALGGLRGLVGRNPGDVELNAAYAVALLGEAKISEALQRLDVLDAKASQQFSLWYNWCVGSMFSTDRDRREKAVALLKERRAGVSSALEKNQVEVALAVAQALTGGN